MIYIEGKDYVNYEDVCREFDIDFNEFQEYMNENKHINQYELLRHFIPNLKFHKYDSFSGQFKHCIYYISNDGWWMG